MKFLSIVAAYCVASVLGMSPPSKAKQNSVLQAGANETKTSDSVGEAIGAHTQASSGTDTMTQCFQKVITNMTHGV